MCPASGCGWLQIGHKLVKDNDVRICWYDFIVKFFWSYHISLVNSSYWFKFHVNIVIDFGVMTILVYKRLTRNPDFKNIPVWVLSNIPRIGWVMDTKFATNISNKNSLNAAKCQDYSLYRFWVVKGKPIWVGVKLPPTSHPATQIRVKNTYLENHVQTLSSWKWIYPLDLRF